MTEKRQIACNKLFNICMIIGFFLAWAAVDLLRDAILGYAIAFGILALLFIAVPAFFTPVCYLFDRDGISLCYLFLANECYLWKNIYSIEVDYNTFNTVRYSGLDLLFTSAFRIYGESEGEPKFYMNGRVRKSFRTKYLLEKYWDGTVTGYLFEGIKKRLNKRKKKKQMQIECHLTDEIVPMERKARAETRKWIEPFDTAIKQYGLELRTKHLYITNDFEELKSRPKEGYTYTFLAEIMRNGETDENCIVVISVDLVYVRLGKTSYHGVYNKHAEEELRSAAADVLSEIKEKGIELFGQ